MPALVTAPPILLTSTYQRSAFTGTNPFIWQVGSAQYQVLAPVLGTTISVIKSTDEGLTWTALDTGNEVTPTGGDLLANFYNPTTGIIYILFRKGGSYQIASFNTAAASSNQDLYGPTSSTSPAFLNSVGARAPVLYQKSDGTLVVISAQQANPGPLKYITLPTISGSWDATFTQIGALTASYTTGVVVDSSDRAHLVYVDDSPGTLTYLLLDAVFSPGSPIALDALNFFDGTQTDQTIWNSNIVITWTGGSGSNDNILKVAIGTPLSGASFTTYTVSTVATTQFLNWAFLSTTNANALVVFGAFYDYTTSPVVDQLLQWVFDGVSSFGSPILFYDEVDNPPTDSIDQSTQFIHTGGAPPQLSNGRWIVSTAMEVQPPMLSQLCAGFALVTPTAGIAIACPVAPLTATQGILYTSAAPIVTGDTPPDTFALLSGSSWMTIDAATGVVSGIPNVSGSVTYTIQVTDSLGNTATVSAPCGLTVNQPLPFCIMPPATPSETLVLINEPLENQGT